MVPDGGERTRQAALASLLRNDVWRTHRLAAVEALGLPDCWIGAGFVRSAVWDALHGRAPAIPDGDVDVVWFDRARAAAVDDRAIEAALALREPAVRWSVKNQARMHARNGDAPYGSTEDALRAWPESATAVAVRSRAGTLEILAPFGLVDLFALVVRPTPSFEGGRRALFEARVGTKRWLERWPLLRVVEPTEATLWA